MGQSKIDQPFGASWEVEWWWKYNEGTIIGDENEMKWDHYMFCHKVLGKYRNYYSDLHRIFMMYVFKSEFNIKAISVLVGLIFTDFSLNQRRTGTIYINCLSNKKNHQISSSNKNK